MTAEERSTPDTEAGTIRGWHAHVYFDTATAAVAEHLRVSVSEKFDVRMGRWHKKLVGPHPRWSYQIGFDPGLFATIIPFLALNRDGLTVFIHPETGDDLTDHTAHAIWMGKMLDLNLDIFRG